MLSFIALLLAAAAPAPATSEAPASKTPAPEAPATDATATDEADILESAMAWWERITVTVDGDGKQQSCRYETSAAGSEDCDVDMAASIGSSGKSTAGLFKKVTFERRFSPGGKPDAGKLQPGDTLLGRQVMYLTIDGKGAITSCKVVATAGEARSAYGCDDARKEQFKAEAAADGAAARQAFMTILSYGHTEQIA